MNCNEQLAVWRGASILSAVKGPLPLGPVLLHGSFPVKLRKAVEGERFRIQAGKVGLLAESWDG